jgi:hypothetical protein
MWLEFKVAVTFFLVIKTLALVEQQLAAFNAVNIPE